MQMKAKAVIEVLIVFSLTLLLIALVSLSPIGGWERQVSNRFFVEYYIFCHEYCGGGHHLMVGKLIVTPAKTASANR